VNILGSADHTVTRSLHIEDQDGNEIEQHIDAQPERWREDPELVVVQPRPSPCNWPCNLADPSRRCVDHEPDGRRPP
jgi:catechol-2,3-dioxygenase